MPVARHDAGLKQAYATLSPADITCEYLTSILRDCGFDTQINGFDITPVGAGQIGETFRITLQHDAAVAQAPVSLIGKFATSDPTSRHIAAQWSLYEREVRFYSELARQARIAVPSCYGAALASDGTFALFLEDLAPGKPGDQFAGITPATAISVMREAAKLHGAFWDQDGRPELAWLETGPLAQPFYAADVFRSAWTEFKVRYADVLTDQQRIVCEQLAVLYDVYIRPLNRPRCVTHNDFRPDNIIFGPGDRLKVVDWQSAAFGHNAVDISYLIGGAFTPEDRRDVERGLLHAYYAELMDEGVSGYSKENLQEDYRHFAFAGINVAVGAAMLVKRTERGDRMFMTMLDRHVAHVRDWDSLSLLEKRK